MNVQSSRPGIHAPSPSKGRVSALPRTRRRRDEGQATLWRGSLKCSPRSRLRRRPAHVVDRLKQNTRERKLLQRTRPREVGDSNFYITLCSSVMKDSFRTLPGHLTFSTEQNHVVWTARLVRDDGHIGWRLRSLQERRSRCCRDAGHLG